MKLYLGGIGVIAPGLADWGEARAVLKGEAIYRDLPLAKLQAASLPAAERRRATAVTKLALDVALQACGERAADLATVFASSGGEVEVIDRIFQELATPAPQISPTLFHNSVHNAASGYWSIATGSRRSAMSLSAFDDTFAAGLLEAGVQAVVEGMPVLLVCYDFPPLPPIARHRPLHAPFGVALLLQPEMGHGALAQLDLQWPCSEAATVMSDPALETVRLGNPAGRSLPLLAAVARGESAVVALASNGGGGLRIAVQP